MIQLLCFPHARCRAHPRPGFSRCDRGELVALPEALTRPWSSDAHLTAYSASRAGKPSRWRLNAEAPGEFEIVMNFLILDCDGPEHESTPEWRASFKEKASRLPGQPFVYFTRGGARVLWKLKEPFPITSPADALEWRSRYLGACEWLQGFGITADRACSDWGRLFRLPHVVRDGEPQCLEVIGDATAIGNFELPPAEYSNTSTLRACDPAPRVRVEPMGCDDSPGILRRLLAARGHIDERVTLQSGETGFKVICPNDHEHRTHDGYRALLLDGAEGRIVCVRTACKGITNWMPFFSSQELEAVGLRTAIIKRVYVNDEYEGRRTRICVMLDGADLPYVRVSEGTRAWRALFAAAGVEVPFEDDSEDLQGACDELRGRVIRVELDGDRVRRILEAA